MEKVSIIIPVYNIERYLPQCLDSILQQSYQVWEAILVDDGSTDLSGCICDEYAQKDGRFRVIHKENGGAASAKNVGLDHVSGDYVAFIDSDDYVDADWLDTAIAAAHKYSANVVEFEFDKVYSRFSEKVNSSHGVTVFTAQSYLEQYLDVWTSSLFWNKLFRAELVEEIRFRTERRCIDDEFFTYKVISAASTIVRIADVLYHYRQRVSSAVYSHKNQRQIADDSLEVLIERYRWISARFPDIRKIYLKHGVQILHYFATFSHTSQTIRKFRRISRYYMWQAVRYRLDISSICSAIRLQFIPTSFLLQEKENDASNRGIEDYFI